MQLPAYVRDLVSNSLNRKNPKRLQNNQKLENLAIKPISFQVEYKPVSSNIQLRNQQKIFLKNQLNQYTVYNDERLPLIEHKNSEYPDNFTPFNPSPNFIEFNGSRYSKAGILLSPQSHQYETLNSFQYSAKNSLYEKKEKIPSPKKFKSVKLQSGYNSYYFKLQEKNNKKPLVDDEHKISQIFKHWDIVSCNDNSAVPSSMNLRISQEANDQGYPENNLPNKKFILKNSK